MLSLLSAFRRILEAVRPYFLTDCQWQFAMCFDLETRWLWLWWTATSIMSNPTLIRMCTSLSSFINQLMIVVVTILLQHSYTCPGSPKWGHSAFSARCPLFDLLCRTAPFPVVTSGLSFRNEFMHRLVPLSFPAVPMYYTPPSPFNMLYTSNVSLALLQCDWRDCFGLSASLASTTWACIHCLLACGAKK